MPTATQSRKIASVFFLNNTDGWALLSSAAPDGEAATYELAMTHNSGITWLIDPVPLPGLSLDSDTPTGDGEVTFVDQQNGWIDISLGSNSNFRRGLLIRTGNGGLSWSRPAQDPGIAGSIVFIDRTHGWIAGGGGNQELYQTANGGDSWVQMYEHAPSSQAASVATYDIPVFIDHQNGYLPVTFSGPEEVPSVLLTYATSDSGTTWKLDKTVPISNALAVGENAQVAFAAGNVLTASVSANALTLSTVGPRAPRPNRSSIGINNGALLRLSFSSLQQGWVLVTGSGCELLRGECGQVTRVMATQDGGLTWVEITPYRSSGDQSHMATLQNQPNAVMNQTDVSAKAQLQSVASASPLSGTHISEHMAFDVCGFPSIGTMNAWWMHSPYFDVGFYLGGANRHCKVAPPTNWISTISGQGWGVIPLWVGLQAPCAASKFARFDSDPTDANAEGVQEATQALQTANAQGLTQSIIYYDMEDYPQNTCGAAVQAFLSGWTTTIQAASFKAGIYVNIKNQMDFTQVSPTPDDVWVARYVPASQISIWNLGKLCDRYSATPCQLWSNQQRIHQYAANVKNISYGSAAISNIDLNIVDASVAGGQGVKPYSYSFTSFDYPGMFLGTTALTMNDQGTLVGYAIDSQNNDTYFTLVNGQFTVLGSPPAALPYHTRISQISNLGTQVGDYTNASLSSRVGFIDTSGKYKLLQPSGAVMTYGIGINDAGQVAGDYQTATYKIQSFLYNRGKFQLVSYPGAVAGTTFITSLNGDFDVAGFHDANVGFIAVNGSYSSLAVGSNYTQPQGINADAEVVGIYYPVGSGGCSYNGFIYQQGTYTTLNYPGATCTALVGVNDEGIITGYYVGSDGYIHGLVISPN